MSRIITLKQSKSTRDFIAANILKRQLHNLTGYKPIQKTKVFDPEFDAPIVNQCRHDFEIDPLGRTVCKNCNTPKYSTNQ